MTSRNRASQVNICFGYKTALQILRTVERDELQPLKGKTLTLPNHAPKVDELSAALELVEAAHPHLQLEKPVHVLVGTTKFSARGMCRPHACTTAIPGSSFLRKEGEFCLAGPELALVNEATRQTCEIALLELAWELCGSYQTWRTGVPSAYDVKPLATTRLLREFTSRVPSLGGARKLARVLPYVADGSASARETKCALIFGLPMMRGGYGFGIPRMNYEVAANDVARAISGRSSFRCDLCWPEVKLDVEYQSKEHHEGETSRIRDSRRANALAAMGWTVIGITHDELDSLIATDAIAVAIRRQLRKRQRLCISDYHARKLKLRRQLGLTLGYD